MLLEEASTELDAVAVFEKSALQETKELTYKVQTIDARKPHNTTLNRVFGAWVRETGEVRLSDEFLAEWFYR